MDDRPKESVYKYNSTRQVGTMRGLNPLPSNFTQLKAENGINWWLFLCFSYCSLLYTLVIQFYPYLLHSQYNRVLNGYNWVKVLFSIAGFWMIGPSLTMYITLDISIYFLSIRTLCILIFLRVTWLISKVINIVWFRSRINTMKK